MKLADPHTLAITRAHVNANEKGVTFVLAFNEAKSEAVLCCSFEKLKTEHHHGLTEEDVFYTAEPGQPVPA